MKCLIKQKNKIFKKDFEGKKANPDYRCFKIIRTDLTEAIRSSKYSYYERVNNKLNHDGSPYHIETSQLICCANQWTGFYMIVAVVVKKSTTPYGGKCSDLAHFYLT